MNDDLVKRLRDEKMGCNLWCEYYDGIRTIPLCIEAADRIEKLGAALREITAHPEPYLYADEMAIIAYNALNAK